MKKNGLLSAACLLLCLFANSQNLAINTDGSAADANAILDVKSSNKGILIPRMSTAQRLTIPATKGLLVYDSTTHAFWYNTGAEWKTLSTSSALSSGDAWLINGNFGTTAQQYVGTNDNVPLSFRVKGDLSGRLDPHQRNTSFGILSLS